MKIKIPFINPKISAISAIFAGVLFFISSILNLLAFAIQNKVISPTANSSIKYITSNFSSLLFSATLFLFLFSLFIYLGYFKISKNKSFRLAVYIVFAALIISSTTHLLSINSTELSNLNPIKTAHSNTILAISYIFLSITLIKIKSPILTALAVLYIIQALVWTSLNFIPVKIMDVTIAIRILEAVFFFNLSGTKR